VLAQRKYAKGLAVRERILQAAIQLLAARGYGAVPLVDVARAAGLTKNHILHHFRSKAGLALAALDVAQAAWRGDVLATTAMYAEPHAALGYMISRLAELQRQGWPHARLLASFAVGRDALPPDVVSRVDGLLGDVQEQLRLICRDLRRAGGLAPEYKARTYAAALLGMLIGTTAVAGAGLAEDASALEALPALLGLRGLAPPAPEPA
jgi:AcrR family transcriptional regulator